jgi:cell division protein FtsL
MSPAQAAAEARTSARSSVAAPARAPGPRRPKIVPVREVEAPKGRVARVVDSLHLGNQLGRIGTLAAAALFLSVFGVVIFQTLIVQGQARLDNLNARVATEQERSRDLHQQVADLEAPSRIVDAATNRLGMVLPGQVGYLSPSADDAARSAYVAPPPTTPPATTAKSSTSKSSTSKSSTSKSTAKTTTSTTTATTTPKTPTKKSTTTTTPKATTP